MKKQRWMDTLDIPDRSYNEVDNRYAVIQWLNSALYYAEVRDLPMMHHCLASAGGRIVAWRKSLDDQGWKNDDILVADKPLAMWIAACIRAVSYDTNEHDLRWVEAVLRSMWRKEQR